MELNVADVDLTHPECFPEKLLLAILKKRYFKGINLDRLSHRALLDLYKKYVLPLPQRLHKRKLNVLGFHSSSLTYRCIDEEPLNKEDSEEKALFKSQVLLPSKPNAAPSGTCANGGTLTNSSTKVILKRYSNEVIKPIEVKRNKLENELNLIVAIALMDVDPRQERLYMYMDRLQLMAHELPLVALAAQENQEEQLLALALEHRSQITRLESHFKEELTRFDMKLILQIDQKVTLEKAGVPGFFVTNNPTDIRVQMYLLSFITRLGDSIGIEKNN